MSVLITPTESTTLAAVLFTDNRRLHRGSRRDGRLRHWQELLRRHHASLAGVAVDAERETI